MVRLRGRRVVLRDFAPGDLDAYAAWLRPGHAWRRFDGPYHPEPDARKVAEILARLRAAVESDDWPEPRRRLVIADAGTDALVGTVAWRWISKDSHWPAAGIAIFDPRYWGRGLGHEALGLWCDYLFRAEPRLVRLDLRTWSGNERMMRLAERLGFVLEARYRDARLVGGRRFDALGYGVLRGEWETRYPAGFRAPERT